MIFSSKAAQRLQRVVAGLASAAALALAASCGGGTTQYEPFVPQRLFAFGDETSALTGAGQRYGVNGLDANGNIDCLQQPIWVQQVAGYYGFSFAECNPSGLDPQAKMLAAAGTRVADLTAQIEAQVAAGGFRDTDMSLVLAGANDIIELYRQYPGRSESSLTDEAKARGGQLGKVVNRLIELKSKVIVSTVPDVGLTPFALAEQASNFDTDRAAMLTRLTQAFNGQLGVTILLDGRYVGLMQTDLALESLVRSPGSSGFIDITSAVCTVATPLCTTATLLPGADPNQYLWADDKWLSPGGQNRLASLALDRARRNPF
jgi:outer membrane lipase/esterase